MGISCLLVCLYGIEAPIVGGLYPLVCLYGIWNVVLVTSVTWSVPVFSLTASDRTFTRCGTTLPATTRSGSSVRTATNWWSSPGRPAQSTLRGSSGGSALLTCYSVINIYFYIVIDYCCYHHIVIIKTVSFTHLSLLTVCMFYVQSLD